MGILKLLLDLIFPPHCAFCGSLLKPGGNECVCKQCAGDLEFCSSGSCCKRCGKPADSPHGLCSHCKTYTIQNFERICSVVIYKGKAKDGIVAFKKNSAAESGVLFAKMISDRVKDCYGDIAFDGVAAVPPRRMRMKKEHFDQAGFLAAHAAKNMHIPYLKNLLFQKENRKKQSSLSFTERYENVNDNFAVRKTENVFGKTILVIDDVCTSRATLNECARALKTAGAKKVYCATLATTG